jgi:hypothetical protein
MDRVEATYISDVRHHVVDRLRKLTSPHRPVLPGIRGEKSSEHRRGAPDVITVWFRPVGRQADDGLLCHGSLPYL